MCCNTSNSRAIGKRARRSDGRHQRIGYEKTITLARDAANAADIKLQRPELAYFLTKTNLSRTSQPHLSTPKRNTARGSPIKLSRSSPNKVLL